MYYGYRYEEPTPRERYEAIQEHLDAMFQDLQEAADDSEQRAENLEQRIDRLLDENRVLSVAAQQQTEVTNRAYSQRAIAAVAFAHTVIALGGVAGVGIDGREDQPDAWRVVLYIDTPAGQISWHIAPDDQAMLQGLPKYVGTWDGTFNSCDTAFYQKFTMSNKND
jgi:ElaB/YqjD/DUF883 family membrane-anchored ribosome-binding protein